MSGPAPDRTERQELSTPRYENYSAIVIASLHHERGALF